jgi:radical SAM enzyme (TIGR01210 family)
VIVECHPALVGGSTLEFRSLLYASEPKQPDRLPTPGPSREGNVARGLEIDHRSAMAFSQCSSSAGKLEVAMGLETTHPQVLEKLNKRMTLDQFRRAAQFLRQHEIALRVFVLVKPPFLDETESLYWAKRSLDFAFECDATAVSLIPTRFGNGALEALAARGEFSPPKLATLEAALEYGLGLKQGRVFADVWDLEKFSDCNACFEKRFARLREMNVRQIIRPRVACECCQGLTLH